MACGDMRGKGEGNGLTEEMVLKCYDVSASRGNWTHKETGSGDPGMFLWCTFSKGL
jgi:hypothetical protein